MAKKAIAGLFASVLLGMLCAGAIITLAHSSKKAPSSIHTTSKALLSSNLCSTALHKESCLLTLSKLSPKRAAGDARFDSSLAQSSSTKTDIFRGFIAITLTELEKATKQSTNVAKGNVGSRAAAAKNDCGKLLTDALQYAKKALALVEGKGLENVKEECDDIGHMLTAALTYMYTCVDSFEDKTLNEEMDRVLNNATMMGSNALGVVNSISSVRRTLSSQPTSRKMLGYDVDQQGYPTWFSVGDRKLLQENSQTQPHAVVAQDGSGQYKTINEAIAAMPSGYSGRYVIYVKAGVYDEQVLVPRNKERVTMYGDGMEKTIITGNPADSAGVTKLQAVLGIYIYASPSPSISISQFSDS